MKQFLTEHPTEFVFVNVKPDYPTRGEFGCDETEKMWKSVLGDDVSKDVGKSLFLDPLIFNSTSKILNATIADLRGKILFINQVDSNCSPFKYAKLEGLMASMIRTEAIRK